MTSNKQELIDQAIDYVATGQPLRQFCRENGILWRTFYKWLDDPEAQDDRKARFARAREEGAHNIAQDCIDIADDGSQDYKTVVDENGNEKRQFDSEHVQRSKLRVHTRLQLLARWFPQLYGEKQQIEHSGGLTVKVNAVAAADLPEPENG